jgi:hypothetical protein
MSALGHLPTFHMLIGHVCFQAERPHDESLVEWASSSPCHGHPTGNFRRAC